MYQNFAKLVEELNRADISIVIMFDEFDLITLNPNFDVEFYSWLRSLASHYKVAFLTSSLSQLHQLCASKKISDSPFFNIFTAFHVGAFSRSEVETMVRGLLDLSLMEYSFDAWMDEIIAQAGFIPFFIQIYCANLFDLFPTQPSASEVAEAFREEAKDHFEHIRRNLSPDETECLQLIIANKKIPAKLDAVLQLMIRKGYVLADNGNYRLFSAAFDSFYRQYSLSKTGKTFWSKLWKK